MRMKPVMTRSLSASEKVAWEQLENDGFRRYEIVLILTLSRATGQSAIDLSNIASEVMNGMDEEDRNGIRRDVLDEVAPRNTGPGSGTDNASGWAEGNSGDESRDKIPF